MVGWVPRWMTVEDRFNQKWTPVTETGCWLWTGKTTRNARGNGNDDIRPRLAVDGKQAAAHRVSYELHVGPIPSGMCVCHKCDTPLCVNPEHLFLGTREENNYDRHRKGRTGYLTGEAHPNAKLKASEVMDIRRRRANGEMYVDICKDYGVNPETAAHAVKGFTWRNV